MSEARPSSARWVALLVAAVAIGVYLNTLGHGFVVDDEGAITSNPTVTDPLSLTSLFGTDFWGQTRRGGGTIGAYRPFVTLTFALDWRLGGGLPRVFHLHNALLHGLASALFFLVLRGVNRASLTPLAVAILFALHPMHTDAVASIVGRADVLGFIGCALTWWFHRREGRAATVLSALSFALAMLSKESSLTLLPLLAIGDLGPERASLRARLTRYALFAATVATVTALRYHAVGSLRGFRIDPLYNTLAGAPLAAREVTAVGLFGRATELLVAPHGLLFDYGPTAVMPSTTPNLRTALGALAITALLTIALRAWRRSHTLTEAAAWVLIPGTLACNALVLLPMTFAERHWYLPSAGFLTLVAAGLSRLEERFGARALAAVTLVAATLQAPVTWTRNRAWASSESLSRADAEAEPRSVLAQMNVAITDLNRGRLDDAIARCTLITRLLPTWSTPWGCIGVALANRRRDVEAERAFRTMRATGEVPCQYRIAFARFLYVRGRYEESRDELRAMRRDGFWPAGATELARAVRDARLARDAGSAPAH